MRTIWQQLLDALAADAPVLYATEMYSRDQAQWNEIFALDLLREIELADAILCQECGHGHWEGIVWIEPGKLACFGCPEAGIIEIPADRLRRWRLDPRRLAALVATALDIPFVGEAYLEERFWRLGRRRIGGRYHEVFLTAGLGVSANDILSIVPKAVGRAPTIVFMIGRHYSSRRYEGYDRFPPHMLHFDLRSISSLINGQVTLDFDYLEDRLSEGIPAPRRSVGEIPTTPDAMWKDVTISVFDGMIQVEVHGKRIEKEYSELGISAESQQVHLLKLFAAGRGTLSTEIIQNTLDGATPARTRVGRLRSLLQSLFPIDDDPIPNSRKDGKYTCAFQIKLASDDGFPTPSGTRWIDFSFHERTDGRLLISAGEKTRRRAMVADGDGTSHGEAMEMVQQIDRTYAMEDIVPRSPSGKLSAEGCLLLAFLRSGGRLNRPIDDMGTLLLSKRLREWVGLSDPPLTYSHPTGTWVTGFSCSSDLGPRA